MTPHPSVLVLGGGPDPERPVSLQSAASVAGALRAAGAAVHERTIDRPDTAALGAMPGAVVFPVLHGAFGEGGPLQDLLEALGRPYVGSGPGAARLAMDKLATKLIAATLGIPTKPAAFLAPEDAVCPLPMPVVVKPVREGSSVGLHLCHDGAAWARAHAEAAADVRTNPGRAYMVEPLVAGRELTVGLLDRGRGLEPLPVIEIRPASGTYDYQAKYERDDTQYTVDPDLPPGVGRACAEGSVRLAEALGVRHLCRVDFLLDASGKPWLLEVNTMPGFTGHSLLPMAARASGLEMPDLCSGLIPAALQGARADLPIT